MEMKERKQHGMLYKDMMVRKLLDSVDPKEQTRRPITFNNSICAPSVRRDEWKELRWDEAWLDESGPSPAGNPGPYWHVPFRDFVVRVYPRIQPGDIIWVKEKWGLANSEEGICLLYPATPDRHNIELTNEQENKYYQDIAQWAADVESGAEGRYRSSMLMPRWASRIDLKVLQMRSQRIQEISGEDAKAEGVKICEHPTVTVYAEYKRAFHALWDSINEDRGYGWETNHPVWIHDFKRVEDTN